MRTFAPRFTAPRRTKAAPSVTPPGLLRSSPRSDTSERNTGVPSVTPPGGLHAFGHIPVLPTRGSKIAGLVHDRDAFAALGGPEAELDGEHGAESAPAPRPETRQEPETLREGGEKPSETEAPAEGDTVAAGESDGESESEGCAKPTDHAGVLALIDKAGAPKPGRTLAYGFTFWAAGGITYPALKIDWTGSGNNSTGTVKKTAAGMGPVEALYLKPGTYEAPRKVTAHGPKCGASGKQVPFFSKVDSTISGLAKQAEQEHCDDYKHAFNLSYGKWAGIINAIAGTAFGPGSRKTVEGQITAALNAKGNKSRNDWIREAGRLKTLSLQRDQGDHSMKPDGDPKGVDAECTKVEATSVKGTNTKIPGPSTATLIK